MSVTAEPTHIHKFDRPQTVIPFERRLDSDSRWALNEGSVFFQDKGGVQDAVRRIATRLDELGIPYAIVGGMALFAHGFRRFTEDVDVLVNRDDLQTIHDNLEGRGYLAPFANSKNLRDAELGVRIEFLLSGGYPGDGKPKPVAFPSPSEVAVQIDGRSYLSLPKLVELKLASGMTGPHRGRDLVDIQQLIEAIALPKNFADQLHPYVQAKYQELWQATFPEGRRFLRPWHRDQLSNDELQELLAAGLEIAEERTSDRDIVFLATTDPVLARRFEMADESEFMD